MKKKELRKRIKDLEGDSIYYKTVFALVEARNKSLKQELTILTSANHDMHRQLVELREQTNLPEGFAALKGFETWEAYKRQMDEKTPWVQEYENKIAKNFESFQSMDIYEQEKNKRIEDIINGNPTAVEVESILNMTGEQRRERIKKNLDWLEEQEKKRQDKYFVSVDINGNPV